MRISDWSSDVCSADLRQAGGEETRGEEVRGEGMTGVKPRAGALRYFGRIKNGTTPASGEADYWDGDVKWATPEDPGRLAGVRNSNTKRQLAEQAVEDTGKGVGMGKRGHAGIVI